MRRFLLSLLLLMLFSASQAMAAARPAAAIPETQPAVQQPSLKVNAPASKEVTPKAAELTKIRWANHIDAASGVTRMRLVIDSTGPVQVESVVGGTPTPRLLVYIRGAVPGEIDNEVEFDGKIIERLNLVAVNDTDSRIVIHLPLMVEEDGYKVFTLKADPQFNKPNRIVIDIDKPVPPAVYNFTAGLKNKVVTIDPGHGGSDPGAIGLGRTMEKNVTLAVSKRVKTLLEKAGAKVLMTREDDRDVFGPDAPTAADELKARVTVANNKKADLFVSIHANSFTDRAVGGTSTYYYQKTPYDALLAQCLQTSMLAEGGLKDRRVNTANFYVIKRSIMPAALVELAFISNPEEEKLLNSPQFQNNMAQAIFQGISNFFTQAARQGGVR